MSISSSKAIKTQLDLPQGAVLGPPLFTISKNCLSIKWINFMPKEIYLKQLETNNNFKLFGLLKSDK